MRNWQIGRTLEAMEPTTREERRDGRGLSEEISYGLLHEDYFNCFLFTSPSSRVQVFSKCLLS